MPKLHGEPCELNMTPMIDVVFQLMIFFIVTIKLNQEYNPDVKLEFGKYGPTIKQMADTTLVIEINRFGWTSIHNMMVSRENLAKLIRGRYNRYGQYPVLIRGDYRAKHKDIRAVMDMCTSAGIWKITFAAIKEKKAPE